VRPAKLIRYRLYLTTWTTSVQIRASRLRAATVDLKTGYRCARKIAVIFLHFVGKKTAQGMISILSPMLNLRYSSQPSICCSKLTYISHCLPFNFSLLFHISNSHKPARNIHPTSVTSLNLATHETAIMASRPQVSRPKNTPRWITCIRFRFAYFRARHHQSILNCAPCLAQTLIGFLNPRTNKTPPRPLFLAQSLHLILSCPFPSINVPSRSFHRMLLELDPSCTVGSKLMNVALSKILQDTPLD
jgi:hypothetical protein